MEKSELAVTGEEILPTPGPDSQDHTAETTQDLRSSKGCLQDCIAEDIQYVRDHLPEAAILTLTREYVTVVIM
jgi:hypothetical protein